MHYLETSIPDRESVELRAFAKDHGISLTFQGSVESSPDSLMKILVLCCEGRAEYVRNGFQGTLPKTSRAMISGPVTVEIVPKWI